MNFKQKLANYKLGNFSDSDLPMIGLTGLEENLESESLTILAGLSSNENAFILNEYFSKALKELEIDLPTEKESLFILIDCYAEKMLNKEIEIYRGLDKIKNEVLFKVSFEIESEKYVYDSIKFDVLYGLYINLDELIHDEINLGGLKSKKVWIKEIEEEVMEELKKWKKHDFYQHFKLQAGSL